jgi:DNA polymerase
MEKGFFSEIVDFLQKEAHSGGAVALPEKVRNEFFGSVAVKKPSAAAKVESNCSVPENRNGNCTEEWQKLAGTVRNCSACPLSRNRRNTVFGEGNINAELMFIGEGPGADEDAQARPFVGEAGQLLTKMIAAMGYAREDVYIANIVKCRPPGNRNPGDDEAAACIGYLHEQIRLVSPKVIVLLGSVPLRYLMNTDGITRHRGVWMKYGSADVMPTFHPAFLLRDPSRKRPVWEDLQQVMTKLGKELPLKKKG